MSHREENREMKTLDIELDLSPFREIIKMKKEAEKFLASASEETPGYRDKQNIILNCDFLLMVRPALHYLEYESVLDSIDEEGL